MPKTKAIVSLSGLIDSDMDNSAQPSDVEMMPTPDSNQENAAPVQKARGRQKTATSKKFTKPKRRASGGSAISKKAAPAKKATAKRAPLKEQANEQQASDTEEVDGFEDLPQDKVDSRAAASIDEPDESAQVGKPKGKRGRPAKSKLAIEDSTLKKTNPPEKDGEFEYTPTVVRQSKGVKKASATGKPAATKYKSSVEPTTSQEVIPETQEGPMDVDETAAPEEDEEAEEAAPQSVFRQARHGPTNSRQPQAAVARRRAGSASDTERSGNDAATRRKLGEMTKKFENLDLKFRNLREVGIKEAEANFEKLKKQSEDRTKGMAFTRLQGNRFSTNRHSRERVDSFLEEGGSSAKGIGTRITCASEADR